MTKNTLDLDKIARLIMNERRAGEGRLGKQDLSRLCTAPSQAPLYVQHTCRCLGGQTHRSGALVGCHRRERGWVRESLGSAPRLGLAGFAALLPPQLLDQRRQLLRLRPPWVGLGGA